MQNRKKRSSSAISPSQDHDDAAIGNVSIIIALPEERNYFREALKNRPGWTLYSDRSVFFCDYQTTHGKVLVKVQTLEAMGHIEAVAGTSSAIVGFSPDFAIMIGIAGSMNPNKVGLGDVVVSNQAKFIGGDKVASLNAKRGKDPKYILGDINTLQKNKTKSIVVDNRDTFLSNSLIRYERGFIECKEMDVFLSAGERYWAKTKLTSLDLKTLPKGVAELPSSNRDRQILNGWLLGSHHVVDSAEYRDYLNEKNVQLDLDIHRQNGDTERVNWTSGELLAVDMESYGMLKAVNKFAGKHPMNGGSEHLVGGISVRGVSDLCEDKGELDGTTKNTVRSLAARNATEVGARIIETLDYSSLARNQKP